MKLRLFLTLSLLLALAALSRLLDTRLRTIKDNFYFVPSANYLAATSATHKTVVAYIFFIRGVLDISESFPANVNRMQYLLKNFKVVRSLQPNIAGVYLFAGLIAPRNPEEMAQANQFLSEALSSRPDDWKIPYWIGLNYLQMGDYAQAINFYKQATAKPSSPNFLKTNLAYLYYRSGEINEGAVYLQSLLFSVKDARVVELLKKKVEWLQTIALLQARVEQYLKRFGSWPNDLGQLQEKGLINDVPFDYLNKEFFLEPSPTGKAPRIKRRHK